MAGPKRIFRSRRAQSLQNRRLDQKCQCKRSNVTPHSAQKFGRYLVRDAFADISPSDGKSNSNYTSRVGK
jgi:hypothetical protein